MTSGLPDLEVLEQPQTLKHTNETSGSSVYSTCLKSVVDFLSPFGRLRCDAVFPFEVVLPLVIFISPVTCEQRF